MSTEREEADDSGQNTPDVVAADDATSPGDSPVVLGGGDRTARLADLLEKGNIWQDKQQRQEPLGEDGDAGSDKEHESNAAVGSSEEADDHEEASAADVDTKGDDEQNEPEQKQNTEEEPKRREPRWRAEQADRYKRQAKVVEDKYLERMQLQEARHAAELAELRAQMASLKAAPGQEQPQKPGNVIEYDPDDPMSAFQGAAKKFGLTADEFLKTVIERNGNDGNPTPKEAIDYARKAKEEAAAELKRLREEREAERAEAKRLQEEYETQGRIIRGTNEVLAAIDEEAKAGAVWWREHVPDHLYERTVRDTVAYIIGNQDAIIDRERAELARSHDPELRQLAKTWVPTASYAALLVDNELSGIYARFNPDANPDFKQGSPRAKDTRQDAPGKPAQPSKRTTSKVRVPSNRTAATSGQPRKLTMDEKRARFLAELERAVRTD